MTTWWIHAGTLSDSGRKIRKEKGKKKKKKKKKKGKEEEDFVFLLAFWLFGGFCDVILRRYVN